MTLAAHIAALNAEKLAWIAEDPDNRWTGLYVEELDFWAEMGVYTVADFKRHEDVQMIWEMYKDVTGIRPRHMDFDSMSDEDLQQEIRYLETQMEYSIEADAEWQAMEMAYAQEDAEQENIARDEAPLPIDYVACHHQDGWL